MFNKDFFPTPDWLTEKLMEGISSDKDWRVLEPSAGKGTLVEAAKEIWDRKQNGCGRTYDFNVDVIEIEPQLQAILASAGHHLVSDDFLRFNGYVPYDLIIANFPSLKMQNTWRRRSTFLSETVENFDALPAPG